MDDSGLISAANSSILGNSSNETPSTIFIPGHGEVDFCWVCDSGSPPSLQYEIYNVIMTGILLPLVGLFGLVSNTMNAYVYTRKSMQSSMNLYLCALALSDICVITTAFFLFFMEGMRRYHPTVAYIFGAGAPILFPSGLAAQTCSVYFTVAAAIDCFLQVVCPKGCVKSWCTTKRAIIVIVLILILSIGYNIPHCFEVNVIKCWDSNFETISLQVCMTLFRLNELYLTVYYVYMYTIVMAMGPLFLLVILNVIIILVLALAKRRKKRGYHHPPAAAANHTLSLNRSNVGGEGAVPPIHQELNPSTSSHSDKSESTLCCKLMSCFSSSSSNNRRNNRRTSAVDGTTTSKSFLNDSGPKSTTTTTSMHMTYLDPRSPSGTANFVQLLTSDAEPVTSPAAAAATAAAVEAEGEEVEAITLILVVFLFIFCNSLALIINFLEQTYVEELGTSFNYMVDVSNLLVVCNSSANFIFYYVFGESFRRTLHDSFRQYSHRPRPSISSSGTTASGKRRSLRLQNQFTATTAEDSSADKPQMITMNCQNDDNRGIIEIGRSSFIKKNGTQISVNNNSSSSNKNGPSSSSSSSIGSSSNHHNSRFNRRNNNNNNSNKGRGEYQPVYNSYINNYSTTDAADGRRRFPTTRTIFSSSFAAAANTDDHHHRYNPNHNNSSSSAATALKSTEIGAGVGGQSPSMTRMEKSNNDNKRMRTEVDGGRSTTRYGMDRRSPPPFIDMMDEELMDPTQIDVHTHLV